MPRQFKLARKMKNIPLKDAAKDLGVAQSTLSGWESGRMAPSIDGLTRAAQYYGVSTDFLLGLTSDSDPRPDWLTLVDPTVLPALHETPVYVEDKGWAFVDAVENQFRFADGSSLPFTEAGAVYLLPPAYLLPARPTEKPLEKQEVTQLQEVWVEPISADAALRDELRGWYRLEGRYVENEMGQRFYLDFYGSKWLAYPEMAPLAHTNMNPKHYGEEDVP